MGKKRRITITLVSDELYLIKSPRSQIVAYCAECGTHAPMVTADKAAAMAGLSSRTIYQRIETGKLHFKEATEGLLVVCLNSLERSVPLEVSS